MDYFYPKRIETTTGHSVQYSTQKITNPSNLCSDNTALAYWGVKEPTWVGSYMRNYYDSVTSRSGSYYIPETIVATTWDTKDVPQNAKVNQITIEYKWEQISYSCDSSACFGSFDKPTLSLVLNGKTLTSFKGAKPEAIRYNNNKVNINRINTNNANLSTLHSHVCQINDDLTIADLNNLKIRFTPAPNISSNHCRIIMQFIRIKVDYTKQKVDLLPSFRIKEVKISPSPAKLINDNESEPYTYICTIQNYNPYLKPTNCTVLPLDDDIHIINNSIHCTPEDEQSQYDTNNHIWSINKFTNNQATLSFKAYSENKGTKRIKTTINKYFDSIKKDETTSIDIIEAPNNLSWNIEIEGEEEPYIFDNTKKDLKKGLKITIERDQDQSNRNETLIIDTKGWIKNNVWHYANNIDNYDATFKQTSPGIWQITNLRGTKIIIKTQSQVSLPSGEYDITVTHKENKRVDETKSIKVYAVDHSLPMNYFKLRLEDGSDVRYNSLIFSSGDDLNQPLTYEIKDDNFTDDIEIIGEDKHIPVSEAKYIKYKILSNKSMENVLCTLDVYNVETGEKCSDIIIGCDDQASIFNGKKEKFCVIDTIVGNEEKNINFIVQSDVEQKCIFKLKLLNYDEYDTKWKASNITFKDMPSIKMSISADNDDINTTINDIVTVNYCIENLSHVDGKKLKFQLHEPPSFQITEFAYNGKNVKHILTNENNNNSNAPYFNEYKRIITFPKLEAATYDEMNNTYNTQKYCLTIKYKTTKKGIHKLRINTYDDKTDEEDDQWVNSVQKNIMVDISNNTIIRTSVSNPRPYINELIDFKINLKNYLKKQDHFSFIIKDIGAYDPNHKKNDYKLEYYTCEKGEFIPNTTTNNNIGTWNINNININDDYEIILSLRAQELGNHIIETIFTDSNNEVQKFENIVNVLENNKQIDFRVYHATDIYDVECNNCDALIEICDDDYIDLGDELYYVCEVTNNNRNAINDTIHIYARLPNSFLENGILCSSTDIEQDTTNILHIRIPNLKGCSTKKVCFKIQPSTIGTFKSNFMLTTKNSHVYHQLLTINVDEEFNRKNLEHKITIYNFEKTNHYFRYELDGDNNLFKFFNQGNDRSLRMVETEKYNKNKVEVYKGTNLNHLIREIAANSKYVEPELLRIGSNQFATKGYEMYPDGFMRRFGLLNSEVFHYTGQLPTISNLVDKAMRWDIDIWDNKVWGGGIYDNGVFDLTIDYAKIPTNFNILDTNNPIQNLQALVDKTKPFGTQAICYYSAKLYLDLKFSLDMYDYEVNQKNKIPLKINDMGLISSYIKHDNSMAVYYDLFNINLNTNVNVETNLNMSSEKIGYNTYRDKPFDNLSIKPKLDLMLDIFDEQYRKKYISECFDIVQNIYAQSISAANIDITKNYTELPKQSTSHSSIKLNNDNIYIFDYDNNEDIIININNLKYNIKYVTNNLENFTGFTIDDENKILYSSNFNTTIHNYSIQIQMCELNLDKNTIHIFCSINNNEYIHIGYIVVNKEDEVYIAPNQYTSFAHTTTDTIINFKIKDLPQTIKQHPQQIVQFNNKNKWKNINNILTDRDYAIIENNKDVDIKCKEETIQAPTLALKYNNINLQDNTEIIDIGFKFKAKSNKENFINDLSIDLKKDGDAYIPDNHLASKIYYPNSISNINKDYINSITLQQPNITICSHCLKTSLGLYDQCPHCGSNMVSLYDQKKKVTICYNPDCNWITNGHYNYCPHCLSTDVEQTKVDFNKTYCYNCGNLEDDYYSVCPKCFSKNILHMNNDETKYEIEDKSKKNIETITIKTDTNRVNIFNLEINTDAIRETIQSLEYLQLHIYGNNYNDGKFYYCSECGTVMLDYQKKCPSCNNTQLSMQEFNNFMTDIYYQVGNKIHKVDHEIIFNDEQFDITIDMNDLVMNTAEPTFKLLFYIENPSYDLINDTIESLDLDEQNYDLLISNLPIINTTIDNIYYDYKYKNENEWINLDKLEGINHTGVRYIINNDNTDYIKFGDFDINNDNYEHIFLNIAGINKADKHIVLDLKITDQNNKIYTEKIHGITPNLFEEEIDLLEINKIKNVKNMSIQIRFENVKQTSEIIITNLFIRTVKEQNKNILNYDDKDTNQYNIVNNNDTYFINTNDIFKIKNQRPYYLDNKQLVTNLVAFINFGHLKNDEYIRLYNFEMILLYKNKYGQIITEHITNDDETYTKQLINNSIQKNNTEVWGENKTSLNILNNLESDIFNNNDEESLQAIPLKTELTQAFTITENSIGKIMLNYYGKIGYPSDNIILQIFDDHQNNIGNLLFTKEIVMPKHPNGIMVDINLNNLPHGQYWYKIIDKTADNNNYHRFSYNINTQVGNLIINDKKDANRVLSFAVYMNVGQKIFYNTPITIDINGLRDFTTTYILYRYNTRSINNAYLNNINIETGYVYDETNKNE